MKQIFSQMILLYQIALIPSAFLKMYYVFKKFASLIFFFSSFWVYGMPSRRLQQVADA